MSLSPNLQFTRAAELYRRLGLAEKESHCLERAELFDKAVQIRVDLKQFDKAIELVEKFNMTEKVCIHL